MLKKTINYTDYEDNLATVVCYFHLNKFEWLELGKGLILRAV